MTRPLLVLAALLTLLLPAAIVFGHGGRYRGPAGEVPPGQRDPKDPQPPSEGGDPRRFRIPNDTPLPGPGPIPAPRRLDRPRPMDFANWLFWWHYNKDEILTRAVARRRGAGPGLSRPPSREMVTRVILPALRRVAKNKDLHPDIRGGALIAMARAGGEPGLSGRLVDFARREPDEEPIVRESAILALALIGDGREPVRDFLIGVADDRDDRWRVRCFAMVALGLLRDASQKVHDCLVRRLDGTEKFPDVKVAALCALGLIGDRGRVPEMLDWFRSGRVGTVKLTGLERATLLSAIGRIGDPKALAEVVLGLSDARLPVRRSAAIALGTLLPRMVEKEQLLGVEAIAETIGSERDERTRNNLVISLGRIGAAPGVSDAVREACVELLSQATPHRRSAHQALALGLVGFGEAGEAPRDLRIRIADTVRETVAGRKGDKIRIGAFATALGMLGDDRKETVDLLLGILRDRGEERKLRRAAAVTLGIARSPAAVEPLLRSIRDREDRDLRKDTILAAGLLGDPRFVEPIVKVYRDPKASQFVLGSTALALGWIGDRSAVRPLLVILEPGNPNGEYPDLTRALAAVALGRLAMRGDTDVLDRLSRDANLSASTAFLDELLTIL